MKFEAAAMIPGLAKRYQKGTEPSAKSTHAVAAPLAGRPHGSAARASCAVPAKSASAMTPARNTLLTAAMVARRLRSFTGPEQPVSTLGERGPAPAHDPRSAPACRDGSRIRRHRGAEAGARSDRAAANHADVLADLSMRDPDRADRVQATPAGPAHAHGPGRGRPGRPHLASGRQLRPRQPRVWLGRPERFRPGRTAGELSAAYRAGQARPCDRVPAPDPRRRDSGRAGDHAVEAAGHLARR